jgi:hypothetical protein
LVIPQVLVEGERVSTKVEKEPDEKLGGFLFVFDSLDLKNEYIRRTAVKPLYDYFQTLVYEVAWRFCGQDKNCLRNQGLVARWSMLNNIPSLIEEPEKWSELIKQIHKMRERVEHNDNYFPDKIALEDLRKRIPEFTEWFLTVGRKYYEKTKAISFVERYLNLSDWYIRQADWIIHQYGDKPPYIMETNIEEQEYNTIKPLRENLCTRLSEIHTLEDIKKEDLDNLVDLIKETERIDARETAFVYFKVCPKCGSKIVETQRSIYDYEEPIAVVYRVGCEKCDFELNSETFDV